MSESAVFFPEELWIGKQVQVTNPTPASWTITAKIGDETSRRFTREVASHGEVSFALCKFLCHSNGVEATMLVEIQAPYLVSELVPARIRQRQASTRISSFTQWNIESHHLLRQHRCSHVPTLLGLLYGQQDLDGPVPDGSAVFLIQSKVPGVALGTLASYVRDGIRYQDGVFWNLEEAEREKIRHSFETAYRSFSLAGVQSREAGLHVLFWDDSSSKVIIPALRVVDGSKLTGLPFMPRSMGVVFGWGLANVPPGVDPQVLLEYGINNLEGAGWIL